MQVRHSHPSLPEGQADYLKDIITKNLPFSKGLDLAEIERLSDARGELVTIYLHKIQGMIQATTDFITYPDTYVIIADGKSFFAYNVGGSPLSAMKLFDRSHYDTLITFEDKLGYVTHGLLGSVPLRSGGNLHVVDQHKRKPLDCIVAA